MSCYRALIDLLTPKVSEEYFRIFPARLRTPEKWTGGIKKKAQEVARYVRISFKSVPPGAAANLSEVEIFGILSVR